MCLGGPSAPTPVPARQAAKMPDSSAISSRAADLAKRRMGYAAAILTPQTAVGLPAPATTGSSLLGS